MDVSSWDFVDTKILTKIKSLDSARAKLQEYHQSLSANSRLYPAVKRTMIKYSHQTQIKIKMALEKEKLNLIDYYDRQIMELSNNKYLEKIPFLNIQEESTVDHSKIMDQMKSTTTGRRHMRLKDYVSVQQFSIREKETKRKGCKRSAQVRRLKRKLKRMTVLLRTKAIIRKYNKCQYWEDTNENVVEMPNQQLLEYLEDLRLRDQENNEYIELLRKKLTVVDKDYQKQQSDLRLRLQEYAGKLEVLSIDHCKIEELEAENETLRLERDELLKLLKRMM